MAKYNWQMRNIQSKDEGVQMVNLRGKRFDCGSVEGFIQATNYEYNKRRIKINSYF